MRARLFKTLPWLLALTLSPARAVETPDFTFFTIPDLYFAEPTVGTIQTGDSIFGMVLAWLLNNAVGLPASTDAQQQVPLSRLLGNVCAVHEGKPIGAIACPLSSLYRRALATVNSLGTRASNLANSILNNFLGLLGNAVANQLNSWVAGAIGMDNIKAVASGLQAAEDWLADTVSAVERQVRRSAYRASSSWLMEVFPQGGLTLTAQGEAERREEARQKAGALVGALQATNVAAVGQVQEADSFRQALRNQVAQVEEQAPQPSRVAQALAGVTTDLAAKAEPVASAREHDIRAEASVRGVLVEMGALQIDALKLQLTSEDRLVRLAKEQILAQAATNQILAAQTKLLVHQAMQQLEGVEDASRAAAEAFVQQLAATSAMLEGVYRMPAELSETQKTMEEVY
ncbi:hypothetical protein [Calidithermus roseus]|uniref:Uncharacterized protein n=1 Tax=Calidithermus roseus TaxID=1644118 RepID=A0A399EGX4_9DEIN|nr:hypothetical protein [Calidithermus roseus]RIH82379.1 hypothetical protein Mrose_03391 [Calidithermus roseus]